MFVRNWREITPWITKNHGQGIDWRMFSQIGIPEGEKNKIDPKTAVCLKTIRFLSFARLQAGGAYPAHKNVVSDQHMEEIYCFIKGRGTIRTGENCIRKVKDGDIFYTPAGQTQYLVNDSDEWIDFIAWNANVILDEIRPGVVKNWRDCNAVLWHGAGLRWRMLSKITDMPDNGSVPCQSVLNYADYCTLQGNFSCKPDALKGEEAVYYIVHGTGSIRIGNEEQVIGEGDGIYIPTDTEYQLINTGEDTIELIAFGANVGK